MPPTSKLIRQIVGAVSEFDKAMVVAKLKGARERKRALTGKKVEARKSHAERNPGLVALAKSLRRQKRKGGRTSLRAISAELATRGFLNENGRPFAAARAEFRLFHYHWGRCWTARPDLGERWSSHLVAPASENRLSFRRRNPHVVGGS